MKKIGIDARLYFQTGVGTYLRNLLHYLSKVLPSDIQIFVYVLSKDIRHIHIQDNRFIIREVDASWHTIREQIIFYQILMKDELDLMHFTYFSYPIFYKRPFLATVHDVTPLLYKTGKASMHHPFIYQLKHFAFQYVLGSQIKYAKKIITPTTWVKKQMIKIYGQQYADKIEPISEGVSFELMKAVENTSLRKSFVKPFYLYVGNFYPHKNVGRLIEAFGQYRKNCHLPAGGSRLDPRSGSGMTQEQVKDSESCPDLILVGPDNMFTQKLKQQIEEEKIEGIRFEHKSTGEDLVFFYKHAQALINPSLSEGFGLPLLEASYFSCPVIASDIPVFHELLGDTFTAFDPENVQDIAEKLKVTSPDIASKNSKNPLLDTFSFEEMTKKTVRIYQSLL